MTLHISEVDVPLGEGRRLTAPAIDVEPGERLVVFGPNGAGKSTWLRSIAHSAGSATPGDCSYLPQRAYAFRGTARHNLSLGLSEADLERAVHLAGVLGVGDVLDRPARRLSGGERQRIGLGRTLARSSQAVLLDEPLAALPEVDRWRVAHEIVAAIGSKPAVIVTHDRDVAAVMGTRMLVLSNGNVLQVGAPVDVFATPADEHVAKIVGVGNAVRGRVEDWAGGLTTIVADGVKISGISDVPLENGVGAVALFGAETVTVYRDTDSASGSARNRWQGRVVRVMPIGRVVEVSVDAGTPLVALLTPGSVVALGVAEGVDVVLAVKATAVRIVPA